MTAQPTPFFRLHLAAHHRSHSLLFSPLSLRHACQDGYHYRAEALLPA
jgi:hypothetical protein